MGVAEGMSGIDYLIYINVDVVNSDKVGRTF